MTKFTIAIALVLSVSSSCFAVEFEQQDKQKHFAVSSGLSLATYSLVRGSTDMDKRAARIIALFITMGIGHAKEMVDPIYDDEDMKANLVGASVGLLIPLAFEF